VCAKLRGIRGNFPSPKILGVVGERFFSIFLKKQGLEGYLGKY
jgi:hypothetical protein